MYYMLQYFGNVSRYLVISFVLPSNELDNCNLTMRLQLNFMAALTNSAFSIPPYGVLSVTNVDLYVGLINADFMLYQLLIRSRLKG